MVTTQQPSPNQKQMRRARVKSKLPTTVNGVKGFTRDISTTGLYIVQSSKIELGSHIDFFIDLDTPGGKLKWSCQGEAVRIEKVEGKYGIGVRILNQVIESAQ